MIRWIGAEGGRDEQDLQDDKPTEDIPLIPSPSSSLVPLLTAQAACRTLVTRSCGVTRQPWEHACLEQCHDASRLLPEELQQDLGQNLFAIFVGMHHVAIEQMRMDLRRVRAE